MLVIGGLERIALQKGLCHSGRKRDRASGIVAKKETVRFLQMRFGKINRDMKT